MSTCLRARVCKFFHWFTDRMCSEASLDLQNGHVYSVWFTLSFPRTLGTVGCPVRGRETPLRRVRGRPGNVPLQLVTTRRLWDAFGTTKSFWSAVFCYAQLALIIAQLALQPLSQGAIPILPCLQTVSRGVIPIVLF